MAEPLIRKLEVFSPLPAEDHAVLDRAIGQRMRHFQPGQDIIREGDKPREINVFLSGWACRYKQLEDGRRQILAFFLPGDICDDEVFLLHEMDHSIAALTPVTVAEVSQATFEGIMLSHPRVKRALLWETLVNAAVQRAWTVNLGQRMALERTAHLFCELFFRLRAIRQTVGNSFPLPLTQAQLGEATGLSAVHVNRTLQELRAAKLIDLRGRIVTIPDIAALARAGSFTPNYLHMNQLSPIAPKPQGH